MARRKAKRTETVKPIAETQCEETAVEVEEKQIGNDEPGLEVKEKQTGNQDEPFRDPEVVRQVTALRAICDMEIEQLLTGVSLLRSYFNEEQLRMPALQYFEENLPNVSVINEGDGLVDMKWKHLEDIFSMHNVNKDIQASLLHRLSMGYSRFSEMGQPVTGFPYPITSGRNAMLDMSNILPVGNQVLEDSYQSMAFGVQDGLQTPGANSQRMSIGMTPKTQRHPKHGEILLSVHGSPLGVFKEDNNNMEVIIESEEG